MKLKDLITEAPTAEERSFDVWSSNVISLIDRLRASISGLSYKNRCKAAGIVDPETINKISLEYLDKFEDEMSDIFMEIGMSIQTGDNE